MKRFWLFLICLSLVASASAQGPVLTNRYLWTLAYEDFSDILRRYPGMYPQDYGTLGAPMLFRPWQLHPWELRLERDLVPQNRRSDGLYNPNQQPASELDTLHYNLLDGFGAGKFRFRTRTLPVDSPYTELLVREGWHGFGTLDFAHGQRVYRSMTLELTGQLGWYEGFRLRTESRIQRVRGRIGFDVGHRWRAGVTYAGSNVDTDVPTHPTGPESDLEEAVFELDQKTGVNNPVDPSFRLYIREDREIWGGSFRLREGLVGWVAQAHGELPGHRLTFRHSGSYAEIGMRGVPQIFEITGGLLVQDSISLGLAGAKFFGDIRGEGLIDDPRESAFRPLTSGGMEIQTARWQGLVGKIGAHYAEELPPIGWTRARFRIGDWPRLIAPVFRDFTRTYAGDAFNAEERGADRFAKGMTGVGWSRGETTIEVIGLMLARVGDFSNHFAVRADTAVAMAYLPVNERARYGANVTAQIPLAYGVRLESWSYAQLNPDLEREETRTYSRLYYERNFFSAPLTVRGHVSHEYIGQRIGYSEQGQFLLRPANLVGFRLSGTIHGVTLIWGTENLFKQHYALVPGYQMVAKEEYLGLIWRLWL